MSWIKRVVNFLTRFARFIQVKLVKKEFIDLCARHVEAKRKTPRGIRFCLSNFRSAQRQIIRGARVGEYKARESEIDEESY